MSSEEKETCVTCKALGHAALVHDVKNFKQRRAIVDTLGWQPFTEWFFENEFRQDCNAKFFLFWHTSKYKEYNIVVIQKYIRVCTAQKTT